MNQLLLEAQGHYDLQLGSKGFFTISFLNVEDRNIVIDGGAYLFYSAGLFLITWKEKIYLEKEHMKVEKIWIGMYSFSSEYRDLKILEYIEKYLGKFIKISK